MLALANHLIILLAITCEGIAIPLLNNNICTSVHDVIAGLHAYPSGHSFCSNFIGIHTWTV